MYECQWAVHSSLRWREGMMGIADEMINEAAFGDNQLTWQLP